MTSCVKCPIHFLQTIHKLPSVRFLWRLAAAPVLLLIPAGLTGCATSNGGPYPVQGVRLSGSVFGGQNPVSGSSIQLYAVGSAGDGSAAAPLIGATVTTSDGSGVINSNANAGNVNNTLPAGSFTITGDYTCPTAASEIYLVATGGNPGLGSGVNSNLALMSALGQCGNLSPSTYIVLNELTTISSVAALSNFIASYTNVGSGSSDSSLLQTAFLVVNEYANTGNGTVPGPALPAGYSASSIALQTLGDIVGACVNSAGGVAGDGSSCGQLFTLATISGSPAPTDTVGAIVNILRQPTVNVAPIFALLPANGPFQPALSTAPANWELPITSNTSAQLAFTAQPSNAAAGSPISPAISVTIEDASGNAQTAATNLVTLAIAANPNSGTLGGTLSANAVNGVATFSGISVDNAGNGYTLTASATGLSAATSGTFNIASGAANTLAFSMQPSIAAAGASLAPAVAVIVEDANGNPVTASTAAITMAIGANPGSGTLGGTATVNAVGGIATFSNLSINTAGSGYTLIASSPGLASAASGAFTVVDTAIPVSCYSSLLSASPPTLSASIQSIDSNGTVVVNGGDSQDPTTPFQWVWGDGTTTSGFFPQQHMYASTNQNYEITITATENNGTMQQFSLPVFFTPPVFTQQSFPGVSFQIPSQAVTLQAHYPIAPPTDIEPFSDSAFSTYSRSDVAYVLASIASIDYSFANSNSFLQNGVFSMDMWEGTDYSDAVSYWWTTPMSVGYGLSLVSPTPQWFYLLNEAGKDTALNTPVSLPFGGNTDGNASEIYSETMGDIFGYSSGCQLIGNAASYGIGADAALDLQNSMLSGAANLQATFNAYVAAGAPFNSWNPYNGGTDPTLGTLTSLAWEFIQNAETQGQGYQIPLSRMMSLLQMFNNSMLTAYAPATDSQAAATFRSTLMVAAMSYGFSQDLRSEFEALNFPIDDTTYQQLYQLASGSKLVPAVTVTPSTSTIATTQPLSVTVVVASSGSPWPPTPSGAVTLSSGSYTAPAALLTGGSATINIPAGSLSSGSDTLTVSYTPDASSSSTYASSTGTAPETVTP